QRECVLVPAKDPVGVTPTTEELVGGGEIRLRDRQETEAAPRRPHHAASRSVRKKLRPQAQTQQRHTLPQALLHEAPLCRKKGEPRAVPHSHCSAEQHDTCSVTCRWEASTTPEIDVLEAQASRDEDLLAER